MNFNTLKNSTVLVVDDNPTNLAVLFDYLNSYGLTVLVAEDGESAFELVSDRKPDLILLDIWMPGMNGFEVCKKLKQDTSTRSIPIIFISALTDTTGKLRGFDLGAVDFITKPFHKEEVLARITAHLTIERQKKELQEEIQKRKEGEERWKNAYESVSHPDTKTQDDAPILHYISSLYETVFSEIAHSILVINSEGKIILSNAFVSDLLSISGNDLHSLYLYDLSGYGTNEEMKSNIEQLEEFEKRKENLIFHQNISETLSIRIIIKPLRINDKLIGIVSVCDRSEMSDIAYDVKKLSQIVEQSADLVLVTNEHGFIEYVNTALIEHTGFSKEELIGKKPSIFKSGKHSDELYKEMWKQISNGKPYKGEIINIKKDGSLYYEEKTITPLKNDYGRITHFVSTAKDTTERQKSIELLKENEQLFRDLFEKHVVVKFLIDPENGNILNVNEAAVSFYGYTKDELLNMNINRINALPQEEIDALIADVMKSDNKYYVFPHKLASGEVRTVEVYSTLFDWHGKKTVFSIVHDITSRKQIEKEHELELKLNSTIADLSEILLASNSEFEISDAVLDKGLELTDSQYGFVGYIDDKTGSMISPTLTKDIWEVSDIPPEQKTFIFEKFGGLWGEVLKTKKYILSNNTEMHPKSTGVPKGHIPIKRFLGVPAIIDNKLQGMIALANPDRDYNQKDLEIVKQLARIYALAVDRSKKETSIKEFNKELKSVNEGKDRFFSILAHDLRGPFVGFLGLSRALNESTDSLSKEKIIDLSRKIHTSAESVYALLENLLNWSRLQSGNLVFEPEDVNAAKFVRRMIKLFESIAEDKGVVFQADVDSSQYLYIDKNALETIFRNLITNAIKFNNPGGSIYIKVSRENGKSVILIEDTGIGMSDEVKEKVFKGLYGFSSLGTKGERGTGLGLLLCKDFVEKSNGTLKIESKSGEGSRFYIILPS